MLMRVLLFLVISTHASAMTFELSDGTGGHIRDVSAETCQFMRDVVANNVPIQIIVRRLRSEHIRMRLRAAGKESPYTGDTEAVKLIGAGVIAVRCD